MENIKSKSIGNQLITAIHRQKPGKLFFSNDFMHIGSAEAVNMAFSRLAKAKELERLGKGIYLYPKQDPELGTLYPSLETVAEAIAEKEKVKIKPTGASALNKLGLSTQVPMKVIYLTDGSPRKIKVGNGTITFKRVPPKKLAAKGQLTFLAIQALLEMGKPAVNDAVIKRLTEVLKKEGSETILKDAKLAPGWIASIFYSIAKKMNHD